MIIKLTAKERCIIRADSSPEVPVNEFVEIPSNHYGEFYIRLCHGKEGILVPACPFPANWSGVPKITIVNNSANELNLRAGDEIGELHIRYNPPSPIAGTHLELSATFATRVVKEDGYQVMTECGRVYEAEYIAKRTSDNDIERVHIPRTTEWGTMGDGPFLPRYIMVGYKFLGWTDTVEVHAVRPDLRRAALLRDLAASAELKKNAEEPKGKSPISLAFSTDKEPDGYSVESFTLNENHSVDINEGVATVYENGRQILTATKYAVKFDGRSGFIYDVGENQFPDWKGKDYIIDIIQPFFTHEYSLIRAFLRDPLRQFQVWITPAGEIQGWNVKYDITDEEKYQFTGQTWYNRDDTYIPALDVTLNKVGRNEDGTIVVINKHTVGKIVTALVKRLYSSKVREYPEHELYHGHLFVNGDLACTGTSVNTPILSVDWKGSVDESVIEILIDPDTNETFKHQYPLNVPPAKIHYIARDGRHEVTLLDKGWLMDEAYACFINMGRHCPLNLKELEEYVETCLWINFSQLEPQNKNSPRNKPEAPQTIKSRNDRVNLTTHVADLVYDPDEENGVGLVIGDDIDDMYCIRAVHRVVPWKTPEQLQDYFDNFDITMSDHHVVYFTEKLMKVAPDSVERIRKIFADSKRIYAEVTEPTHYKDLKFKNLEVKTHEDSRK